MGSTLQTTSLLSESAAPSRMGAPGAPGARQSAESRATCGERLQAAQQFVAAARPRMAGPSAEAPDQVDKDQEGDALTCNGMSYIIYQIYSMVVYGYSSNDLCIEMV